MNPRGARSWACGPAPRHQKAGSRMASSLMKLQLHQIGVERRQRSIERAAKRLDHRMSSIGDPCAGVGVAQPRGKMRDKAVGAGNWLGTVRVVKRSVNFRKVPDMGAVQNCGAELGGLDRILSAMLDERAADEDSGCHAIKEAELADSVGDIDICIAVWQFPARAQRRRQARG